MGIVDCLLPSLSRICISKTTLASLWLFNIIYCLVVIKFDLNLVFKYLTRLHYRGKEIGSFILYRQNFRMEGEECIWFTTEFLSRYNSVWLCLSQYKQTKRKRLQNPTIKRSNKTTWKIFFSSSTTSFLYLPQWH